MVKEEAIVACAKIINSFDGIPFDVALPKYLDKLWEIAKIYNTTVPELLNAFFQKLNKNHNI
jgi:hypothetical protein